MKGISTYIRVIENIAEKARDNERLAAVKLTEEIFGAGAEIGHENSGKPYIIKDGTRISTEISISHTKGYIAIATADEPIGIDIEYPSDRVMRVRTKFMDDNEIAMATVNSYCNELTFTTLAWCAKEAAYKKLGFEGVDFLEQFKIRAITNETIEFQELVSKQKNTISFRYSITPEYIVVFG